MFYSLFIFCLISQAFAASLNCLFVQKCFDNNNNKNKLPNFIGKIKCLITFEPKLFRSCSYRFMSHHFFDLLCLSISVLDAVYKLLQYRIWCTDLGRKLLSHLAMQVKMHSCMSVRRLMADMWVRKEEISKRMQSFRGETENELRLDLDLFNYFRFDSICRALHLT